MEHQTLEHLTFKNWDEREEWYYKYTDELLKKEYDITGNIDDSVPAKELIDYLKTEYKKVLPNHTFSFQTLGKRITYAICQVNYEIKDKTSRNPLKTKGETGKQRIGIKRKELPQNVQCD